MASKTARSRVVAGVMLALLLGTGGIAQQPPEPDPPPSPQEPDRPASPEAPPPGDTQQGQGRDQQPPPVFRAGINFVRVDAIVTDKQGTPVTNLAATDFEVTEDGKPQQIESFKLVKLTGSPQPGGEPARAVRTPLDQEIEAAREDVRIFVFFLDDYHVRRGASLGVREPLINFIENQLGPLDLLAVMYPLTPVRDLDLTRNHAGVVSAIEQFLGRKFDYTPRNDFEDKYANYPSTTVEQIRNQVSLSALRALSVHLGGLREGRKSVVLVSEGYLNSLPPQMRDPVASMPGLGNPNRHDPNAGENDQREESMRFFDEMDVNRELRDVFDAANRNNTSIYALDPRGLAAFEFDVNEAVGFKTDRAFLDSTLNTLRVLADETDGRAIVNRNDLEAGLRQIVRDSSSYYLLGYNSTQGAADGKFHSIKVRVKKPGLDVRARKGYWAMTVEETTAAVAPPKPGPPPAVSAALSTIAEPLRGRLVRTWIGTGRAENGLSRVTFVWEPMPAVPGVRREEPAKVSLTAVGPDGRPYYRGSVPESRNDVTPAASTAPATSGTMPAPAGPSRVAFDAPPGKIQLKMAVENAKGQMVDSSVQEIVIPDFTAPSVSISTPVVLCARNGLELKKFSSDPEAIPTAGRDFRRTDRLLIRFDAYAPGTEVPIATARLLNRAGQAMSDLPVRPPASGVPHQVDLPLASLAVGEYLIELKVTGTGGEVKEMLAIKVGG